MLASRVQSRSGEVERAVIEALAALCQLFALRRAAILRFSDSLPAEVAQASETQDDHRLIARIADRELRWLGAIQNQLVRDGHPVAFVREPERSSGSREDPPVGPALAVPVMGRDLFALVCHPTSRSPSLLDHVERIRSFATLAMAALSVGRDEPGQPADGNEVSAVISRRRKRRGQLIGESEELRRVLEAVDVVASTHSTVLILGESGVGKELVAQAIYEKSDRAAMPFVTVNCASIPRELFESEFFGHVRGAFTGAHRDRIGRFELADGGTIVLDEVAEIPIELQPKLLRVLQEQEFEPVGDHRVRRVDVRVIAATNRDLEAAIEAGEFREDLYYRLSVFPIHVPPLRERKEDILALARHFVSLHSAELGRAGLVLTDEHEEALLAHHWPGNVRELHNVIERAVIRSIRPPLRIELACRREKSPESQASPLSRTFLTVAELRERERENIVAALTQSSWRVGGAGGAAELLGMRPSTLRDRLHALGIRRP